MASLWDLFGQSADPLDPYIGAYGPRSLTGPGRGSPAGNPFQAREVNPLVLTRERLQRELEDKPFLQPRFDANTTAEVGTDPEKRRWYQALTLDRAAQTGEPLENIVNNPNYYPQSTTLKTATTGQGVDPSLWAGANPANYATGNASFDPKTGRWVGFAGGPQTSTYGSGLGMELGGIEGQAGLPYARAVGYTGPSRTAIGPAGPQGTGAASPLEGNTYGNAYASAPAKGRTMPASLWDQISSGDIAGAFTPRDASGQPIGFGDAIAQNRQSLIGLGMGLLTPRSLAVGAPATSAWSNALGGYQQGAQTDAANAYRQAQAQHLKSQDARAAEALAFQKQQAGITDFQRAAKDLGLQPGTPEYADAVKKFYEPKLEGDWKQGSIKDPNTETEHPFSWNQRTNEYRWGPTGPPPSLAAATRSNPFAGAVNPLAPGGALADPGGITAGQRSGGGVYGEGGNYSAAPSATTGTAPTTGAPQLPTWAQSLPPSVRKEAEKEMLKGAVKLQTQQQAQEPGAKASAQHVLRAIDDARTIATTSNLPTTGIMGNVLKNVYQPGKDLDATLNTIKAGVSLDKLSAMRAASPSGASGLGAVTEGEHRLLQASIAALDQAQGTPQFLRNLQHVEDTYNWVINRTNPNEPPPPARLAAAPASARQTGGQAKTPAIKPGYIDPDYPDQVFKGGNPNDPNSWATINRSRR